MADTTWFEGENNPGAGDLSQMQALKENLARTAEAARQARRDLSGLKDHVTDAVWRGQPAEKFKEQISGRFLDQLHKLDESYQDAADGFAAYIAAVSDIEDRAHALATRIYVAQDRYERATANLKAWADANPSSVSGVSGSFAAPAFGEGSPYVVGYVEARVAHAPAGAGAAMYPQQSHATLQLEVDDAWDAMQVLYRQMHDLKTHDRAAADDAVIGRLDAAHSAGIKNESGWHKFCRKLATWSKRFAFALVVVAVIAVVVLMLFGPTVGLLGAIAAVTTTSGYFGVLGAVAIYGSALAAAGALVGDLGQRYSDGEEKPGWLTIGADAVGVAPGLGKAGQLVSKLGGPAAETVAAIRGAVDSGKLHAAYGIERMLDKAVYTETGIKYARTTGLLEKWTLAGEKSLLQYGENRPVDSGLGAALWFGKKTNGLWTGAAQEHPELGKGQAIDNLQGWFGEGLDFGEVSTMSEIGELHASNPQEAADAHAIAVELAGGGSASACPGLHTYPQAVRVP